MDPKIEILKKNHQERMTEFLHVLNRAEYLPGCKVLDEWRFHLELTLKSNGWIALWKPSKERVALQTGPEPFNELIMVEKVDYHNFEASVVPAESQGSFNSISEVSTLSAKVFIVPLEELYPCIKQHMPDLDGIDITNTIDKLRFFRQYLWLPWDEEDDSDDWRVAALEPRMQLLYDMEQGLVSCEFVEKVKRLRRQAWNTHELLRMIEQTTDEEGVDLGNIESHIEEEEGLVIRMMQLHHRLDNIKKELERIQNPLIRNLMVREKQRALTKVRTATSAWTRLVWQGGAMKHLEKYLETAKNLSQISEDCLKVYSLLQMALEEASCTDLVLLAPGKYVVTGSGGLEEGGIIQGLNREEVYLSGCEAGDVMFSLKCEIKGTDTKEIEGSASSLTTGFTLKNVILDARGLEICLLLNSGHITLDSCQIDGGGTCNGESVGVMVREGAKLTARHCSFIGFCTGIVAYEGAELNLLDCTIQNCETGMQLYRGVKVELEKCIIAECSASGVLYKWKGLEKEEEDTEVTHDLLNSLPGVLVKDTDFQTVQVIMERSSPNNPDASIYL